VFSVEAEFIEKVVAEYGPCTFFYLLVSSHWTILNAFLLSFFEH
jgi:hypothetical protein